MDFIAFQFFSMLESAAVFMFVLVLFRFKPIYYWFHILFSAVIMSQASYLLRAQFEMDQVSYVTMSLMIILLWLLFRVQLFYSFLMTLTGFLYIAVVQSLQMLISVSSGWMDFKEAESFTRQAYMQQSIFFLITALICMLLIRKKIGFTFIPYNDYVPVKLKGLNGVISIILIAAVIAINLSSEIYSDGNERLFNFLILLLIIILAGLLLLIMKRESKE